MNRIIFLLFSSILFFLPAFGQDLNTELNRKFTKYSVVQLDSAAILRKVDKNEIALVGTFPVYLETNGIFSNRLIAGQFPATVKPVKGKLVGLSASDVRLTIGDKVKGYIFNGQQRYYIEPAVRYSSHAKPNDYIIYLASDVIGADVIDLSDDMAEGQKMAESNLKSMSSSNVYAANPTTLRVIEIATEADYQWVQITGGPTQANNEIANIINMADGIYRIQLGLTFQITFQHVWTTPDPYRTDDPSNLLTDFRIYWNGNFPVSSYPRDTAHLFTGKFSNTGLAYIGTICVNSSLAYGLSGRIYSVEVSWIVLAHEVGHNLGADHADGGDCADTIMNTVVSFLSDSFCQFSINQIVGFVNSNGSCLQAIQFRKTKFDFDGDGKADLSVFRPGDANWYVQKSQLGYSVFQFGSSTDKIAPADYDGDGKTDYAVFRPSEGNWYIRRSSNGFNYVTPFGISSDKPVPADYDDDGKADIAIFRPSVGEWWYLRSSDGGNRTFQFGNSSDKPVPDDFTGDGKADLAFWRPSTGEWFVQRSENNSFYSYPFGTNGDIPTTADFDGDKKADSAIFRPSTGLWYILRSTGGTTIHQWGLSGDIPVPADYDGDGLADIVVWRPSNGVWYALNTFQMQFGQNGDIPIPGFLVVQ